MEVLHYLDSRGHDLFQDWLDKFRDSAGRVGIQRRIDRIADAGNIGDHKFCGQGIWELKIDIGPGYRVYYVAIKKKTILLLCAGNKRTQKRDIMRAVEYWNDYQQRI